MRQCLLLTTLYTFVSTSIASSGFKEEELIGDLLQGPRGEWKEEVSVPYRDWQDAANQKRIELPARYADFETTLLTGDLLFVKNNSGEVSHVVLQVGKISRSPDGVPLILDSTATGTKVCNGVVIPNGIQLRPFKRGCWYASKASHVLRIIPEGK